LCRKLCRTGQNGATVTGMGTLNEMTASRNQATSEGKCGHQMGTAASRARACGKPAKFEVQSEAGHYLVCGIHQRAAAKWSGFTVTPLATVSS
jgi:hypothetical protein